MEIMKIPAEMEYLDEVINMIEAYLEPFECSAKDLYQIQVSIEELFTNISITSGTIASINNYNGRKVVFADMFGKPGNSGSPVIDEDTRKVIGIFWGGIKDNNTMEVINSFTPLDVILKSLK